MFHLCDFYIHWMYCWTTLVRRFGCIVFKINTQFIPYILDVDAIQMLSKCTLTFDRFLIYNAINSPSYVCFSPSIWGMKVGFLFKFTFRVIHQGCFYVCTNRKFSNIFVPWTWGNGLVERNEQLFLHATAFWIWLFPGEKHIYYLYSCND